MNQFTKYGFFFKFPIFVRSLFIKQCVGEFKSLSYDLYKSTDTCNFNVILRLLVDYYRKY